jgi:hypothetical protein
MVEYRADDVSDWQLGSFINQAAQEGWTLHSVIHRVGVDDAYIVITEREQE